MYQPSAPPAYNAATGSTRPDPIQLFHQIASDRSRGHVGELEADQLQKILNQTDYAPLCSNNSFSLEACKIMISMLDRRDSGMMNESEFTELLQCIKLWLQKFMEYDKNRTAQMEANELRQCLREFGYQFSDDTIEYMFRRYATFHSGKPTIKFDDYLALMVRTRALTERFLNIDKEEHGAPRGKITLDYEDFIQMSISL
ncbi:hypothetical protein SNEBB_008987 [Seison nebaliae]|nr:hypothetical protein SNEBB_008987 [Seison nebaliae]